MSIETILADSERTLTELSERRLRTQAQQESKLYEAVFFHEIALHAFYLCERLFSEADKMKNRSRGRTFEFSQAYSIGIRSRETFSSDQYQWLKDSDMQRAVNRLLKIVKCSLRSVGFKIKVRLGVELSALQSGSQTVPVEIRATPPRFFTRDWAYEHSLLTNRASISTRQLWLSETINSINKEASEKLKRLDAQIASTETRIEMAKRAREIVDSIRAGLAKKRLPGCPYIWKGDLRTPMRGEQAYKMIRSCFRLVRSELGSSYVGELRFPLGPSTAADFDLVTRVNYLVRSSSPSTAT